RTVHEQLRREIVGDLLGMLDQHPQGFGLDAISNRPVKTWWLRGRPAVLRARICAGELLRQRLVAPVRVGRPDASLLNWARSGSDRSQPRPEQIGLDAACIGDLHHVLVSHKLIWMFRDYLERRLGRPRPALGTAEVCAG